ncbi:hypothetical protein RZN22_18735 [Bacillaceae bacterium S4-13-58]
MIGFLIQDMEKQEVEYLLKREMDELLFDLQDSRIDHLVKQAMVERYEVLFGLFKRVASNKECIRYMLPKQKQQRR